MPIRDREAERERANNLGPRNGMAFVVVTIVPVGPDLVARLDLHFYNANLLPAIVATVAATPALASQIFPISGGHRLRAGFGPGEVRVTTVVAGPTPDTLALTVTPVGDYSTYALGLDFVDVDPVFAELRFKFRPGCFSTDCDPEWAPGQPSLPDPGIDYLAKDYDSFRHELMSALARRVPGWRPSSEADFDQVLIDLFSAAGDELSDFQDRVAGESWLAPARKRVSVVRHARLLDYHVGEGQQASAWLALALAPNQDGHLASGFRARTGSAGTTDTAEEFETRDPVRVHSLLSRMGLYTWEDAIPGLAAGDTRADLVVGSGLQAECHTVRDLINNGLVPHLLIQEWLNPVTGEPAGRDPRHRQLLALERNAVTKRDPATGAYFVRVRWAERDRLRRGYCFTVRTTAGAVSDACGLHGNLVEAFHGRRATVVFREPASPLALDEAWFERPEAPGPWSASCVVPHPHLAYRRLQDPATSGARSTLEIVVTPPGAGPESWLEVDSLVHSDDGAITGNHFVVETDEERRSTIRFGDGINGRRLPAGATVTCRFQVGRGPSGNVGADRIVQCDAVPIVAGATIWNPFDVTDGRDPEPAEEVKRRAPEAYRARQRRAVTLDDYVRRAEEVPGVSRAAARYAWTGSWRTVQLAIDPGGTTTLTDEDLARVAAHLEPVRLVGEDLELRAPVYVPLTIVVQVCVQRDHWPRDVRAVLVQEFSDNFTPDGRMGFFHPDAWTFGQPLHASEVAGRVQAVRGVDHVIRVSLQRRNGPPLGDTAVISARPNEILLVRNDPDHLELGTMAFHLHGGRE